MSFSKGSYIVNQAIRRKERLCTESPRIKKNGRCLVSEMVTRIAPLSVTKVSQEDCDFSLSLLENAYKESTSKGNSLASYIANNLILGLESNVDINVNDRDIPQEGKDILNAKLEEVVTCHRILRNQAVLEQRFDIDRVVKSNGYNLNKIISEMCELIDTYEVPLSHKMNIALENTAYSLASNHIPFDDDSLVSKITEYFMMRDMIINDIDYNEYKEILENAKDNFDSTSVLVEAVLHNGNYFRNMVTRVLENTTDTYIKDHILPEALEIKSEADASDYIDTIQSYIETGISEGDEAALYYSAVNIPHYTPVSKDFISIKMKDTCKCDRIDKLCRDDITDTVEPINEKDKEKDIFNLGEYKDLFRETFANSDDVKDIIDKFKAEQDKSPNKIKQFLIRLHTKSPESIIDDLPDVFTFVRYSILLAVAASSPIGPIIAGVAGLFSWLLSKKLNDESATKLLAKIRSEKKKVQNKIEKTSNDKKKKELEEYLDCIKDAEEKTENFLDKISDEDHSDPDGMDDDDFGLGDDLDFDESAISLVANLAEAASKQVERMLEGSISNDDMVSMIKTAASNNSLKDLGYIIRESSIPIEEYALNLQLASNEANIIQGTAIKREIQNVLNHEANNSLKSIIEAAIADNVIADYRNQVITEKLNLNTAKLALQNAKAKLKDLSTKEKSLSQSVDAAGSGVIKSIEKALTSDRREAIIKGSLIPSFSKCIKGAIALAGVGIAFGPFNALLAAVTGLAASKLLNHREKMLIYDEIDTELKVVEKEIEIAQNDNDMKKYRFLLNYQKKLTRERNRIRYGMKSMGRNIPSATIPGKK